MSLLNQGKVLSSGHSHWTGQMSPRSYSQGKSYIIGFRIKELDDKPMWAKGKHVYLLGLTMVLITGPGFFFYKKVKMAGRSKNTILAIFVGWEARRDRRSLWLH